MTSSAKNPFPTVSFNGELRPSQQEVVDVARQQLSAGHRKLHIVAPPGSGKTVLGLYLWATMIRKPCVVLSPNSAIQSQWLARTDLFTFEQATHQLTSSDTLKTALLNSLTYQSLTLPTRKSRQVDYQALELWTQTLIEKQEVISNAEAQIWIEGLRSNNSDYFNDQYSKYKKRVRDELSKSGDSISLLHQSSRDTIARLVDAKVGVIILDECHHLLGHWGRVLADAIELFDDPIVIGLTATPPDKSGKDEIDVRRYEKFLGDVDYEVPVPSVVKDGFLAPYQDLAYIVRPTNDELKFIANADKKLDALVADVCREGYLSSISNPQSPQTTPAELESVKEEQPQRSIQPGNLTEWLWDILNNLRIPTGTVDSWAKFANRDQTFAVASRQFLQSQGIALPSSVPKLSINESFDDLPSLEYQVPVLDRFVRHFLRRSPSEHHQQLASKITNSLRILGIQITDTGTRPCASPVGRVLAYSQNKCAALLPILATERQSLGNDIRAVVIADFERSSAVTANLKSLMDEETGGAIAAFKKLLTNDQTDSLEPVLLTGSTILIDDEIETQFLQESRAWLADRQQNVNLQSQAIGTFRQIFGSGSDWSPRVYVEMITELFQKGLTKCLVGTRGLLGEGWDANKINVLVDLTTVTTSMSINQLRGRSFRLDPDWEEKTANNWDVICLAAEFNKGFDDYTRFKNKHKNLYGVADDGAIEKGVSHVHPAFTEIKPEGLENTAAALNEEMLSRSRNRQHIRGLWKIGEPFAEEQIQAVEVKFKEINSGGFPPFAKSSDPWSDESLTSAIASAVIATMKELGHLKSNKNFKIGSLAGGYIRAFLSGATPEENDAFAAAMKQVLGLLDRPRYVIPRSVTKINETFLSRMLPEIVGKYFRRNKIEFAMLHAVPDFAAKRKSDVAIFQQYWNQYVSPGVAVYAHRSEGEKMVQQAKEKNTQPDTILHDKEIFL